MNVTPSRIGLGIVVCYLVLDDRQGPSGKPAAAPKGLAICQYPNEEGVYLLACDQSWNKISDAWHPTVLDALQQAEIEYRDAIVAWIEAAP
jgi:hypothetical protein